MEFLCKLCDYFEIYHNHFNRNEKEYWCKKCRQVINVNYGTDYTLNRVIYPSECEKYCYFKLKT